jgi:hypothetical protein
MQKLALSLPNSCTLRPKGKLLILNEVIAGIPNWLELERRKSDDIRVQGFSYVKLLSTYSRASNVFNQLSFAQSKKYETFVTHVRT